MACEYSKNEWKIIDHYGFRNITENSGTPVYPALLYPMLCCKAFLLNDRSQAEHALRRGMQAMQVWKPYRMTPEFDALIAYEED